VLLDSMSFGLPRAPRDRVRGEAMLCGGAPSVNSARNTSCARGARRR